MESISSPSEGDFGRKMYYFKYVLNNIPLGPVLPSHFKVQKIYDNFYGYCQRCEDYRYLNKRQGYCASCVDKIEGEKW